MIFNYISRPLTFPVVLIPFIRQANVINHARSKQRTSSHRGVPKLSIPSVMPSTLPLKECKTVIHIKFSL